MFHRLAYTPLTAQPTVLGLTLRFTSPPSSSTSIRQGRSAGLLVGVGGEAVVQAGAVEVGYVLGVRAGPDLDVLDAGQHLVELGPDLFQAPSGKVRGHEAAWTRRPLGPLLRRQLARLLGLDQVGELGPEIGVRRMLDEVLVRLQGTAKPCGTSS